MAPQPPTDAPARPLAARDLWALAGTALALAIAWRLAPVLLLVFAAVLLALVLRRLARPLEERWRWPPKLALTAVVAGLVLAAGLGGWYAGAQASEQLQQLGQTLPRALAALRAWAAQLPFGPWLAELLQDLKLQPEDAARLAGLATGTLNLTIGAVGSVVLLAALGVYLAADAGLYRRGALALVPRRRRAFVQRALDAIGRDLSRWLLGQALSMAAVGVLTGAGLLAIGMPLVPTLAVLAALLDFVPYVGPIVSTVLVVLVALTEGGNTALWALLVCFAVQQAEAYVVQPVVQRWAVRLAPALSLLAVVLFGLPFGLPGVLLAGPLMVACVALAQTAIAQREGA